MLFSFLILDTVVPLRLAMDERVSPFFTVTSLLPLLLLLLRLLFEELELLYDRLELLFDE